MTWNKGSEDLEGTPQKVRLPVRWGHQSRICRVPGEVSEDLEAAEQDVEELLERFCMNL